MADIRDTRCHLNFITITCKIWHSRVSPVCSIFRMWCVQSTYAACVVPQHSNIKIAMHFSCLFIQNSCRNTMLRYDGALFNINLPDDGNKLRSNILWKEFWANPWEQCVVLLALATCALWPQIERWYVVGWSLSWQYLRDKPNWNGWAGHSISLSDLSCASLCHFLWSRSCYAKVHLLCTHKRHASILAMRFTLLSQLIIEISCETHGSYGELNNSQLVVE